MANAARNAGVTRTIVKANVDKQGRVSFNREIPAHAVNPIVEVNLEDNKLANYQSDYTAGYHHGGTYVRNVVQALQKQHHYRQINLVGHSMGNLEIINYINDNYANANLPKVATWLPLPATITAWWGSGAVNRQPSTVKQESQAAWTRLTENS